MNFSTGRESHFVRNSYTPSHSVIIKSRDQFHTGSFKQNDKLIRNIFTKRKKWLSKAAKGFQDQNQVKSASMFDFHWKLLIEWFSKRLSLSFTLTFYNSIAVRLLTCGSLFTSALRSGRCRLPPNSTLDVMDLTTSLTCASSFTAERLKVKSPGLTSVLKWYGDGVRRRPFLSPVRM